MKHTDRDALDVTEWVKAARLSMSGINATSGKSDKSAYRWTLTDFKIAWLCRDIWSRAEMLQILDIATQPKFDRSKEVGKFCTLMASYIDATGEREARQPPEPSQRMPAGESLQ